MPEDDDNLSLEQMAEEETSVNSTAAVDSQPAESAPAPEPEAAPATPEPESTPEPEPEQPTNRAVIDYYLSQGESWAAKYPDDTALLQAIPHLARKIGERDEDAAWAKKFSADQRAKIEAILSQTPATPKNDEPEYDEAWEYQIQNGTASREIVEKYNKRVLYERKKLRELLKNPEALVKDVLEKRLEERLKPIELTTKQQAEAVAERERQVRVESWVKQNTGEVYTPQGNLTPLGQEADRIFRTHPSIIKLAQQDEIAAFDNAVIMARAKVPAPKGTKPVPQAAIREPAIGTPTDVPKSAEEIAMEEIDKLPDDEVGSDGFAKILAKLAKASA